MGHTSWWVLTANINDILVVLLVFSVINGMLKLLISNSSSLMDAMNGSITFTLLHGSSYINGAADVFVPHCASLSCLQRPRYSLWIQGRRRTFPSRCHSQPHSGSCKSVGKFPHRIQESMSHYSRGQTSPACSHTLQTWDDSWETQMKGISHSR